MAKKPWNGVRRIPENHGADLIRKGLRIFKKHGSIFWLDYGTLLGKIREDSFIPHDGDVDLAVDYNTWNPDIISDLCDNGFVLRKPPNKFTDKKLLKFVGKHKRGTITQLKLGYRYQTSRNKIGGIKICVEIYHEGVGEYKDMMYFWPTPKPNWIFEMPKEYLVPQIRSEFYGNEVYIPQNYEENLKFMYGDNWMIPNVNYTNGPEHVENAKKFKRFF